MADVIIYTTSTCPYCYRAKALLDSKGVDYTEIDVGTNAELRKEMTRRAGGRYTVPQIFVGARHVGGCDDLMAIARTGELDRVLGRGTAV